MTDVDPDAVASAAKGCPSVADLSSGTVQQFATYLPGRQVGGVRITDDDVEVHIVARWGVPLPRAADEVREAVRPHSGGRPVSVFVEDITEP